MTYDKCSPPTASHLMRHEIITLHISQQGEVWISPTGERASCSTCAAVGSNASVFLRIPECRPTLKICTRRDAKLPCTCGSRGRGMVEADDGGLVVVRVAVVRRREHANHAGEAGQDVLLVQAVTLVHVTTPPNGSLVKGGTFGQFRCDFGLLSTISTILTSFAHFGSFCGFRQGWAFFGRFWSLWTQKMAQKWSRAQNGPNMPVVRNGRRCSCRRRRWRRL